MSLLKLAGDGAKRKIPLAETRSSHHDHHHRRPPPATPSSCPPNRQDELHPAPRPLHPDPSQDRISQCYRLLPQRRPHAEGRELLREAPSRRSSRGPGQGSARPLPEEVHGQERFCQAARPHHWRPHCARLRTELLLPPSSPQEQRPPLSVSLP